MGRTAFRSALLRPEHSKPDVASAVALCTLALAVVPAGWPGYASNPQCGQLLRPGLRGFRGRCATMAVSPRRSWCHRYHRGVVTLEHQGRQAPDGFALRCTRTPQPQRGNRLAAAPLG